MKPVERDGIFKVHGNHLRTSPQIILVVLVKERNSFDTKPEIISFCTVRFQGNSLAKLFWIIDKEGRRFRNTPPFQFSALPMIICYLVLEWKTAPLQKCRKSWQIKEIVESPQTVTEKICPSYQRVVLPSWLMEWPWKSLESKTMIHVCLNGDLQANRLVGFSWSRLNFKSLGGKILLMFKRYILNCSIFQPSGSRYLLMPEILHIFMGSSR